MFYLVFQSPCATLLVFSLNKKCFKMKILILVLCSAFLCIISQRKSKSSRYQRLQFHYVELRTFTSKCIFVYRFIKLKFIVIIQNIPFRILFEKSLSLMVHLFMHVLLFKLSQWKTVYIWLNWKSNIKKNQTIKKKIVELVFH